MKVPIVDEAGNCVGHLDLQDVHMNGIAHLAINHCFLHVVPTMRTGDGTWPEVLSVRLVAVPATGE